MWPLSASFSSARSIWDSTLSVTPLAAAVDGLVASARIWPWGHSPAKAEPVKAKPASSAEATAEETRVRVNMGISLWCAARPEWPRRWHQHRSPLGQTEMPTSNGFDSRDDG